MKMYRNTLIKIKNYLRVNMSQYWLMLTKTEKTKSLKLFSENIYIKYQT